MPKFVTGQSAFGNLCMLTQREEGKFMWKGGVKRMCVFSLESECVMQSIS